MKRFLTTSLIVAALAASAAGVYAPVAHAEVCFADDPTCTTGSSATPDGSPTSVKTLTPTAAPSSATTLGGGEKIAKPTFDPSLSNSLFATVMISIMTLFSWLLGIAILVLDYSVYFTVVTMGTYIKQLDAIGLVWSTLRDIGNIVLIFGFLAIGITTILKVDWYGGGTKMLPMLLVAAVFINFSLFISEAVIDTGNLFATQFYTQINGGTPAGQKGLVGEGISSAIMRNLGMTTLYEATKKEKSQVFTGTNMMFIGVMGSVLFIVASFVMFSLAFILIARFVALIFLIILAPIGFAGLAIPQMKKLAKLWWDTLFEQTITAPLLLLLLYIALSVITAPSFLTGFRSSSASAGSGWLDFFTNTETALVSFAGLLLSFLVAMGLLLAVTLFAKKLSAFGAGHAGALAGKLTFGATAWAGRRSVGRISNYAAKTIRSSKYGNNEFGRLFAGVADRGAKASFDIRGTSALKNFPGGGVDAGAAQKGGYQAREARLIQDRMDYAKSLQTTPAQDASRKAAKERHDREIKRLDAEEKTQLAASKPIIAAQRAEVEAARRSGDKEALGNALKILEDIKEQEREKLDPIRAQINETKQDLTNAQKATSKQARQEAYGRGLEKRVGIGKVARPYDLTTSVGSARQEAAKRIIGEAGKDTTTKLTELLEEDMKRRESGSAPAPTPTPAPPPPTGGTP